MREFLKVGGPYGVEGLGFMDCRRSVGVLLMDYIRPVFRNAHVKPLCESFYRPLGLT